MLKALLFDLDGTLYRSLAIREKFAEAAAHTLSKHLHISSEHAKRLVSERRDQLKNQHGEAVPYTLALRSFGVPIEQWHEDNIQYFDPRDYLTTDTVLRESLSALRRRYCLAVGTNNNQTQTERTLEALGISEMFSRLFTYNTFHVLKPDPAFYIQALSVLGIKPNECCVIGDRYNVDLQPAEALGVLVIEVAGPQDIYCLAGKLPDDK